jgi:hypothetical protein
MSVEAVVARIAEIRGLTSPAPAAPAAKAAPQGFQAALQGATASGLGGAAPMATAAMAGPATGGTTGARMVALAQQEVGVAEQPPGSNDAPRIAEYRTATAGGAVGPWCAYFVSWIANKTGTPLGEAGQGFASVDGISGWAQRTGRNLPAGTRPQPGDLIYWGGRHVGMVESVDADGSIHTIEGNSSDAVTRRTYGPDGGGATGYVRL